MDVAKKDLISTISAHKVEQEFSAVIEAVVELIDPMINVVVVPQKQCSVHAHVYFS